MFFSRAKSCLGVDLGVGGFKLVELREEKKRPLLFTYGFTSPLDEAYRLLGEANKTVPELLAEKQEPNKPQDNKAKEVELSENHVNKYAEVLKALYRQTRATAKVAVVSLPVSAVFHAVVTMPMIKGDEFNTVLRAEVKKLLAQPLEELSLDYQILPALPDAKTQRVLVNAVPRGLVAFYTRVFQKLGIRLESLEPESAALARSLVGRDNSATVIVDMGAERTNFFIVEQAVPVINHSIELGGNNISAILKNLLGVEEAAVERIKYDLANFMSGPGGAALPKEKFLEIITPVLEPIVKEVEYSVDLYLHQLDNEDKRPEKIILTGGTAGLPYLADYIAEKFKLKCYVGDPWARVVYQEGLKPALRPIGSRMAVAIGLALRNMV